MNTQQHRSTVSPFPYGWCSSDLGKYRFCYGTYDLYAYDSLPPIATSQLQENLQWLMPLHTDLDRIMQTYQPMTWEQKRSREKLHKIIDSAQQLGLSLPTAFLRLMSSPALQDRIPSCTACYFELSENIIPCPGDKEGYLIRFLNDQQGCLCWYLYLTPQKEPSILVSSYWLDDTDENEYEGNHSERLKNTYICSPSFEAFIYRFWLENTIWFNLHSHNPLTREQQQYLEYYQ
ncbi:MAG TPA: hypothetical protein VL461_14100 [Dictyobacter sp.]|jgi:hypothetical protein|nr:hypothetical protein [Dictyobacter sp.]